MCNIRVRFAWVGHRGWGVGLHALHVRPSRRSQANHPCVKEFYEDAPYNCGAVEMISIHAPRPRVKFAKLLENLNLATYYCSNTVLILSTY